MVIRHERQLNPKSKLTLQVLRSIEGLLLLKEEGVAHKWQSANRLAVSSVHGVSAFAVGGKYILKYDSGCQVK